MKKNENRKAMQRAYATKQQEMYNRMKSFQAMANKQTVKLTADSKKEKETESKNDFRHLLDLFEKSVISNNDTSTALDSLALACTLSVLKKCISPVHTTKDGQKEGNSYNKRVAEVRNGLHADLRALDRLKYANNNAYSLGYNKNGDLTRITTDSASANALNTLCAETLNADGYDLVTVAEIAILEEVNKAKERTADSLAVSFMETPYTIRQLKRKVWIKEDDSNAWEDRETTPIQEVYKAIRRAIMDAGSLHTDPCNSYSYLQEYTTDAESGETDLIYKRLHKYADLGGYACDCNGRETLYSADEHTAEDMESYISWLNLTDRQAQVLQLRLRGYGYKAIGTYLGVTKQAVQNTLEKVQKKALSVGLFEV